MADTCKNVVTCRDFLKAYTAGEDSCGKCSADITQHRLISNVVDAHLAPIIDQARHAPPEDTIGLWKVAAIGVREELAEKGVDAEAEEVGKLLVLRCLQRLASLESQLRITMRHL